MKDNMHCQLDYGELEANDSLIAEQNEVNDLAGKSDTKYTLFWSFPGGKGAIHHGDADCGSCRIILTLNER